jgi:aldehyde dehydrogenase (NAD+)
MTTLEEYHDDNFINGDWVKSLSDKKIEIVDPSTEEIWGAVPASNVEDIDAAVQALLVHSVARAGVTSVHLRALP